MVWTRKEQRQQIKLRYFLKVCVLPSIMSLKRSCWNGYSQPVALWESHTHLANTGSSKLVLVAFCPPRGSSWQVRSVVHSHKFFRCHSLAAPSLQKGIGTYFHMSQQRIFTVVLCPKCWSRETRTCDLQNPGAPREFCSSFTLRQDLPPGLSPQHLPLLPFLDTQLSADISPILSRGLVRTKQLMFDNFSARNH